MNKFEIWVVGWIDIIQGICYVVSFGYFTPSLSLNFCTYVLRKKARNKRKLENKNR